MINQNRPAIRLVGVLLLVVSLLAGLSADSALAKTGKGKKVGFSGDPAAKRGVDYGYDKGYQAGKKDKAEGLKPDPKRHEDFEKPEKYFRVEFGSQPAFVRGFKGGFVGGYQKAFGKKVKIKVPGLRQASTAEDPTAETAKPAAPKPPDAASDAL